MCVISLIRTLKNGKDGEFCYVYFTVIFLKSQYSSYLWRDRKGVDENRAYAFTVILPW